MTMQIGSTMFSYGDVHHCIDKLGENSDFDTSYILNPLLKDGNVQKHRYHERAVLRL